MGALGQVDTKGENGWHAVDRNGYPSETDCFTTTKKLNQSSAVGICKRFRYIGGVVHVVEMKLNANKMYLEGKAPKYANEMD